MMFHRFVFSWVGPVTIVLLITACSDATPNNPSPATNPPASSPSPSSNTVQIPESLQSRIQVQVVTKTQAPRTINAPGEVALDLTQVAKVSSRINGQVEDVFVQLGQRVTKGQPLLAIGSMKLDELVQEFLISKVQVDLAKANFTRTKKLLDEQIVSERRFMEDRAKYEETRAIHQHVTEKLLNMGLSRRELDDLLHSHTVEGHRYILKAPLTGTIASQTVVLGQGVIPEDELLELVDTSHVWIFANLPIEQARQFKKGDQGIIMAKGRPPITAVLAYMAPIADKATLTLRLRFDVANPKGLLKPNEYVEVRLLEETASMLTIPLTSSTLVDGERGVFIRQEQGFTFVPVELGLEGEGWVEVTKGIQAGDEVVTAGVFDLKNALLQQSIEGQ